MFTGQDWLAGWLIGQGWLAGWLARTDWPALGNALQATEPCCALAGRPHQLAGWPGLTGQRWAMLCLPQNGWQAAPPGLAA